MIDADIDERIVRVNAARDVLGTLHLDEKAKEEIWDSLGDVYALVGMIDCLRESLQELRIKNSELMVQLGDTIQEHIWESMRVHQLEDAMKKNLCTMFCSNFTGKDVYEDDCVHEARGCGNEHYDYFRFGYKGCCIPASKHVKEEVV